MEKADQQYASETLTQLREKYQVNILADWSESPDGTWQGGIWLKAELERLHRMIDLLAGFMGKSRAPAALGVPYVKER